MTESSTAAQADRWAERGDVRLRWEHHAHPGQLADPEPLLLVNGLGSPMVAYELGFIAELHARGFDVIRYDNRDAGRSSSTSGGYLLGDLAADAVAVLDAAGWDRAHVFGMSMGGMIVQQLGIDAADRLHSITSLMSHTGNQEFGTSSRAAREALMKPSPPDRDGWLAVRVETEQIWASPAEWSVESSRAKGELLFDYGVQPAQVVHQYTAIMKSEDREPQLRDVQTPTLVMHGSADTLIHPSGGQRTAEVMANASYVELDGMGHDLPATYWPVIADHLRSFVDSLSN